MALSVITVMYIQVEKSDCEQDNDPSMEFQLNSSTHIHACLQLPAVIAGNLPNMPPHTAETGPTADAQSEKNLVAWLDAIVDSHCRKAKQVRDEAGNIAPGSYNAISGGEYSGLIAKFNNLTAWTAEVVTAGESLGRVAVSHVGNSTKVYMKLGPFNGRNIISSSPGTLYLHVLTAVSPSLRFIEYPQDLHITIIEYKDKASAITMHSLSGRPFTFRITPPSPPLPTLHHAYSSFWGTQNFQSKKHLVLCQLLIIINP